jgi:uncharacterized protein
MKMWRVVFDTNVFVSAVLVKNGLPARALQAWQARQFILLLSPAIIAEIQHTLSYERIRRKYALTDQDVADLVTLLAKDGVVISTPLVVTGVIPDDPDDEQILACALSGEAELIVSGDQHLLALTSYAGIPIITVRDFLQRLGLR